MLVGPNSPVQFRVNLVPPELDSSWTGKDFEDGAWSTGRFGIGYEERKPRGAGEMIRTKVISGTSSIYCRARFTVDDPAELENLYLGVDYDDGFVAWINGVEVARSDTMPSGFPEWDTRSDEYESSNGDRPRFHPRHDISRTGIAALHVGENVLAIGVWNDAPGSNDLVLVAELVADQPMGTFVTRGPYLQRGTESGVTVRWRTDRPTDSRVIFGRRPGALHESVSDTGLTTEHRIDIGDLEPGREFWYAVGSTTAVLAGGDEDHRFRTAAERGSRQPIRAWVLGDSGSGGMTARRVRDAYARFSDGAHTDLMIMLGDNAYPEGTDGQYQHAFFDTYPRTLRRTSVWSTPGNHDLVRTPGSLDGDYYEVFDPPTRGEAGGVASDTEAYYAFDHGNAHFVSLNSEHIELTSDNPMLAWLDRDLEAAQADWIIAFWHSAPYSTGRHDSDEEKEPVFMRRHVLPILDEHGVDLVLAGHSHVCQRTGLLRSHYGPRVSFDESRVIDGGLGRPGEDGPYRKPSPRQSGDGIVYATVGCSSETKESGVDPPPEMLVFTRRPGSMALEIEGLRLDARFLDSEGQVRDHFAIVKTDEPPLDAGLGRRVD